MTNLPVRSTAPTSLLVAVALALLPATLMGQERLRPFTQGDGRLHGAPTLSVTEMDLHPGQVQTINLHPGYHTILEFPYPIVQADAGDDEIFLADIVGNKLFLKATKLSLSETSMSVILADPDLTAITYLIRTDESQPMLFHLRYTDPVARHFNEVERRIARRLAEENEARIAELAELRLQQQLLWAGDVVSINKKVEVGRDGERLRLQVQDAQELIAESKQSMTYLRYQFYNGTVAPLEDLYFIVRIVRQKRRLLFFNNRTERELYDVRDVRTANPIPAGTAARGLLIFETPKLSKDESLEIEAVAFNSQRRLVIQRAVVGR